MADSAICFDCGKPTSGGIRCNACNREDLARQALDETADIDRMILEMVADGVTGARLGARLGISRVRASKRIEIAKGREAKRQAGRTRAEEADVTTR
jgi:hypothetical protein